MRVVVHKGNLSKAIAVLNRKLKEDGDFSRSIERSRYIKPSDKKRAAKKLAKYKAKQRHLERIDLDSKQVDYRGIVQTNPR